jgi:formylglycine-generating enzyme required for sulfatase activity
MYFDAVWLPDLTQQAFRLLTRALALVVALIALPLSPTYAQTGADSAYTVSEIEQALRSGTTPTRLTVVLSTGCVVGDSLFEDDVRRLRLVGANDGLINAIRRFRCKEKISATGSDFDEVLPSRIAVDEVVRRLQRGQSAQQLIQRLAESDACVSGREVTAADSARLAGAGATVGLIKQLRRFSCVGPGNNGNKVLPLARLDLDAPTPPKPLGYGFGDEQFVAIDTGTFRMGSDDADDDERPVHTVKIAAPFQIQRTEVTQGQWIDVMGNEPSRFSGCGESCPVESVSWTDVQTFLTRLNQTHPGHNYRLPSEAEWEFAARAGRLLGRLTRSELKSVAWYNENADRQTHQVATRKANSFGLFDMLGNVQEWVEDEYVADAYSSRGSTDALRTAASASRVLRGGSWGLYEDKVRLTNREHASASKRGDFIGFRLARDR